MNRRDYIAELSYRIRLLPREDREDAIMYYEGYFDDMGVSDTEDISGRVDSPEQIAARILEECSERHIEQSREQGGIRHELRHGSRMIWMTILGIVSLPVALPLVIAALALIVALTVVGFSLIVAVGLGGIGMVIGGIGLFIAGFLAIGSNLLMHIGGSLVCVSLGVLLTLFTAKLIRWFTRIVAYICESLISRRRMAA